MAAYEPLHEHGGKPSSLTRRSIDVVVFSWLLGAVLCLALLTSPNALTTEIRLTRVSESEAKEIYDEAAAASSRIKPFPSVSARRRLRPQPTPPAADSARGRLHSLGHRLRPWPTPLARPLPPPATDSYLCRFRPLPPPPTAAPSASCRAATPDHPVS
ncbi:hypothetical protein ABZP36_012067 [Zizania latifolia]